MKSTVLSIALLVLFAFPQIGHAQTEIQNRNTAPVPPGTHSFVLHGESKSFLTLQELDEDIDTYIRKFRFDASQEGAVILITDEELLEWAQRFLYDSYLAAGKRFIGEPEFMRNDKPPETPE